jgi:hypothetical protein
MRTKWMFVLAVAALCVATITWAAEKGYQVTGPVIEVTDAKIVVGKGKEQWEIARNAETKVVGDLKVGEKVTVYYTMTATDIEVKGAKKEKKTEKK